MDDATAAPRRMPGLEIPVCPRCAAENPPARTFCVACGGPMSIIATAGPFETAVLQGRAIGEAVSARRPSGIVVAGAWLLALVYVGPVAAYLVSSLLGGRLGEVTPAGLAGLLMVLASVAVAVLVVWRVTTRYARARRAPPDGEDAPGTAG